MTTGRINQVATSADRRTVGGWVARSAPAPSVRSGRHVGGNRQTRSLRTARASFPSCYSSKQRCPWSRTPVGRRPSVALRRPRSGRPGPVFFRAPLGHSLRVRDSQDGRVRNEFCLVRIDRSGPSFRGPEESMPSRAGDDRPPQVAAGRRLSAGQLRIGQGTAGDLNVHDSEFPNGPQTHRQRLR